MTDELDVFVLGAGRPATLHKPISLAEVSNGARVLDWQIATLRGFTDRNNIGFLGGYQFDKVMKLYPDLNYTIVPGWQSGSILETFLSISFNDAPLLIFYADTLFREEAVAKLLDRQADITVGIDSKWRTRYDDRSGEDVNNAETIILDSASNDVYEVEFSGLVFFKPHVVAHIANFRSEIKGTILPHLLEYLASSGFDIEYTDIAGNWAELNSTNDVARFILGTKAETLKRLEPMLSFGRIGEQVRFTWQEWQDSRNEILSELKNVFKSKPLVLRSSSKSEDGWSSANAGKYASHLNVDGGDPLAIAGAVQSVFDSYGVNICGEEHILVQEYIHNIKLSGVVFTCSLETGAPYYQFNIDDSGNSTESVTSGNSNKLRTFTVFKAASENLQKAYTDLTPVLSAVHEIENVLGYDKLDIEFALDNAGVVHIFQVRPIAVDHSQIEVEYGSVETTIQSCHSFFERRQNFSPLLYGNGTILANMPDWNPAEIIGTRPKPLAASLYQHLITNNVWAIQRAEFGYRDVRPFPLVVMLAGQPYVDVVASLNSFLPASLSKPAACRIVNAYLSILAKNPDAQDKLEFEVAFTSWFPGFRPAAVSRLKPYGVTDDDIDLLEISLKHLTAQALTRLSNDTKPLDELETHRNSILASDLDAIEKIYLLIESCAQLGTLSFAHAARAGFVATTFLRSLVEKGIFTDERFQEFYSGLITVTGQFASDKLSYSKGTLSFEELVARFGHLRPGTYDVSALAYWEDPERYLISCADRSNVEDGSNFCLLENESIAIAHILSELGATLTPQEFVDYLRAAIQTRESSKLEFTKNVSKALDLCVIVGKHCGLNREDCAYLTWSDFVSMRIDSDNIHELESSINKRKRAYQDNAVIELPPVISHADEIYCFEHLTSRPNFITDQKIEGRVCELSRAENQNLDGAIILIPQADPGFDWLFGYNIAGFITLYGGANSHMSIRAAELRLPAAIGVGEKLYECIAQMKMLELDCKNKTIRSLE